MSFNLSSITTPEFNPLRIVVHGVHGVGKTSLAGTFDAPILLPLEDGAQFVDVPRFPKPTAFEEVVEALGTLYNETHDFKTVIIDTLDWLEPLVWAVTCAQHGKQTIEEFGYGKGYTEACAYWRILIGWLDALRYQKGMTVLCLAHSAVKRYEPPDTDAYDRHQMKLNEKARGLVEEWADAVLFASYKVRVQNKDKGFGQTRGVGVGSGDRVIYTDRRPAYEAKNRLGLPHEILVGQDATWKPLHDALTAATKGKYTQRSATRE